MAEIIAKIIVIGITYIALVSPLSIFYMVWQRYNDPKYKEGDDLKNYLSGVVFLLPFTIWMTLVDIGTAIVRGIHRIFHRKK